ncbi:MAG TPA: hypothetical protein VLF63_01525 [Patescibacteria group bacterium]|nr:hypothetical protein [Patescibacteria group bacterium]
MKQNDILLIGISIIVSAVISYYVTNSIFVTPKNRKQSVDIVQPISTTFPTPDTRYFNSNSYNPTQPITIGSNANTNPFSQSTQ